MAWVRAYLFRVPAPRSAAGRGPEEIIDKVSDRRNSGAPAGRAASRRTPQKHAQRTRSERRRAACTRRVSSSDPCAALQ
eukprot:scaffold684_cov202-Prasinococcus_capsulatus_cf.AAC.1